VTLGWQNLAKQAARFSAVGVANTAIGGSAIVTLQWIGLGPYIANLLGYCAGMLFSFAINGRWTFGSPLGSTRLSRFVVVIAASYTLNLLVLTFAIRLMGWSEMVSQVPAMACYTLTNFIGQRYFVFRPETDI
jgi:putative flippase GtrA